MSRTNRIAWMNRDPTPDLYRDWSAAEKSLTGDSIVKVVPKPYGLEINGKRNEVIIATARLPDQRPYLKMLVIPHDVDQSWGFVWLANYSWMEQDQ